MNTSKLLQKLAIAGIAGAAALAVPMEAKANLIIDDFNTTTTYVCSDLTQPGDICDPASTLITLGNTVMQAHGVDLGWERFLNTTLLFPGDGVSTEVCANCQTGHAVSNANSTGIFEWIYRGGTAFDGTEFKSFMYDWSADLAGANLELLFDNIVVATDPLLPATGGATISRMLDLMTDDTSVTEVILRVNGVEELDADIDNAKLVKTPEPGTVLGLVALGGLGLVSKRKKQK
ncbi:PEP-CTERM sorting domain-containing protein [Crocosphaera sp. XPORK-15E]|uniref:PEP-CTERM sorting domain-containing protein n=1 Tax=Crocosphaera sp. XPORK-15E TaxID=3110247 RepID=UPI002B20E19A|nr:PEP-CTERM sorting domain-containing protein [Crocosphaera sp. XPORK-15E]MEA5533858.1 PEP-CTERM sorting domain-containing protein [Crocosphaera sp. XPORK-15E]